MSENGIDIRQSANFSEARYRSFSARRVSTDELGGVFPDSGLGFLQTSYPPDVINLLTNLDVPQPDIAQELDTGRLLDTNGLANAEVYPMAQRGITLPFGAITNDGQLLTKLNVVGVGLTPLASGTTIVRALRNQSRPGMASLYNAANNLSGLTLARQLGILTPIALPPVVVEDGIRPCVNIKTLYSDSLRTVALYQPTTDLGIMIDLSVIEEIETSGGNLSPIVLDKIDGFVSRAKTVSRERPGKYLGCSRYMTAFDRRGYWVGFRKQMEANAASMILSRFWHANLNMQNIAISGELGDWDRYCYIDSSNVYHAVGKNLLEMDHQVLEHAWAWETLKALYIAQGLIGSLVAHEWYGIDVFWENIRKLLPEGNRIKTLELEDLAAGLIFGWNKESVLERVGELDKYDAAFMRIAQRYCTPHECAS